MNDVFKKVGVALVGAALVVVGWVLHTPGVSPLGSVTRSSEYISTSTAASNVLGATISSSVVLQSGPGVLGSFVITGANTGVVNFYNATTSSISKRASTKATSTLLIASIPASAAAGTYTFDAQFTDGLYLDITGAVPTSTVTWRAQ